MSGFGWHILLCHLGIGVRTSDRQQEINLRLIMLLLLAISSGIAVAEWTITGTTESVTDIYVDRATISRSGNLAQLWILQDRKMAGSFSGKAFLSAKLHYEYGCKDNKRRVLQSTLYSGQKASGSNLKSFAKPGSWRPISEGRVSETMWKIVFSKK